MKLIKQVCQHDEHNACINCIQPMRARITHSGVKHYNRLTSNMSKPLNLSHATPEMIELFTAASLN